MAVSDVDFAALVAQVATLNRLNAEMGTRFEPTGGHQHTGDKGGASSPPRGVICMWSGLLSAIPTGWLLCDGTQGTPDLRNRFIVGAARDANPGTLGGAQTHTHAGHSAHVFTQPTIAWPAGVPTNAGHTHDAHTGVANSFGAAAGTPFTGPATHSSIAEAISWPAGVPTNSLGAVDAHSGHDTPDSRPPFYSLAFIQKS